MKIKLSRCFVVSMVSTFFALCLLSGFIIVEKNTQEIISESPRPLFTYTKKNLKPKSLKIHFMGKDLIFNF